MPPGTPILSLTDPNFTVTLQASASDRTKLKVGQHCTVQLVGGDNEEPGTISELDAEPHVARRERRPADAQQQVYEGKIQVGDLGAADGAAVTIEVIDQQETNVLTVPIAAVKQNGAGQDVVRVIDLEQRRQGHRGAGADRPDRRLVHRGHEGSEGQRDRDRRGRSAAMSPDARRAARSSSSRSRASTAKRSRSTRCATSRCRSCPATSCRSSGRRARASRRCSGLLGVLDLPTAGTIRIAGQDVSALDDATRSRLRGDSIGFVFQQFHLIPHLTALGNVETALLYRDMRPRRAARARVRRARTARARASAPTTGRCRCRVASSSASRSARAIVTDPLMILADEPTGALDSANAAHVLEIFKGLESPERAVVMVTHDPTVAEHRAPQGVDARRPDRLRRAPRDRVVVSGVPRPPRRGLDRPDRAQGPHAADHARPDRRRRRDGRRGRPDRERQGRPQGRSSRSSAPT